MSLLTNEITFALAPMPCGCVIDMSVAPPFSEDLLACECPWCEAGYMTADLRSWFLEASGLPPTVAPSRALFRIGNVIVEAGDPCDCGAPLVRERVLGAKWLHLRVPMIAVEILRD